MKRKDMAFDKTSINLMIFDWDGCLANTLDTWMEAYQIILKKLDIKKNNLEAAAILFGETDQYTETGKSDIEFAKAHHEMLTEFPLFEKIQRTSLNLGAKQVVQALSKQYKLAILSNSPTDTVIAPVLKREQLEPYFDCVVGKNDVPWKKPNPIGIHKILKTLKCKREETVIIGDAETDIHAGQKAGIRTILYYPPNNQKYYAESFVESLHATLIIKDFSEILTLFSN